MDKNLERISKLYRLRNYIRYNNRNRITNEDVLQHTAVVSLYALLFSEKFKCDREKLLKIALVHDLGELFTGEIPRNVKISSTKIADLFAQLEITSLNQFIPTYGNYVKEYEKQSTIEAKIVKLADIASAIVYCNHEAKLGNCLMKELFKKTVKRYIDASAKLGIKVTEAEILEIFAKEYKDEI